MSIIKEGCLSKDYVGTFKCPECDTCFTEVESNFRIELYIEYGREKSIHIVVDCPIDGCGGIAKLPKGILPTVVVNRLLWDGNRIWLRLDNCKKLYPITKLQWTRTKFLCFNLTNLVIRCENKCNVVQHYFAHTNVICNRFANKI